MLDFLHAHLLASETAVSEQCTNLLTDDSLMLMYVCNCSGDVM